MEDQEPLRRLLCDVLRQRGFTVLEAADGVEAAILANRDAGPIHLLVTDLVMPGLQGDQLAAEILAVHPSIKILYISGYAGDQTPAPAVQSAHPSFLAKPFTPDQFIWKIQEMLGSAVGSRVA